MSANATRFAPSSRSLRVSGASGSHSFYRLMDGVRLVDGAEAQNSPRKAPQALQATAPPAYPGACAYAAGKPFYAGHNVIATAFVGRLPGKRKITHQYWAVTPVSRL